MLENDAEVHKMLDQEVVGAFVNSLTSADLTWARCAFDSRAFNMECVIGRAVDAEELQDDDEDGESSEAPSLAELAAEGGEGDDDDAEAKEAKDECRYAGATCGRDANGGQHQLLRLKLSAESDEVVDVLLPRSLTVLVPLVDYLNHDRKSALATPFIDSSRGEFTVRAVGSESRLAAVASTNFSGKAKGGMVSELNLNYGPLQNHELLMYYGFCLSVNECDSIVLPLGDPEDAKQAKLLEKFGIQTVHMLRHVEKKTNADSADAEAPSWPLSRKLLQHLRVLHGLDKEADVLGDDVQLEIDGLICECLLGMLTEQLQTPSEDELRNDMWTEAGGAPQQRVWDDHEVYGPLARTFRASQRALVDSNVEAVQGYMEYLLKLASSGSRRRRVRGRPGR